MIYPKKKYYLKKTTEKTAKKKKERSIKLSIYYDYLISQCTHSEHSGKPILNPNRSNIAHLFDKSRHKSIEDNLSNYIYLTLEEHTEWDNLLLRHRFDELAVKFPKGWEIACRRMWNLISLCAENTGFKLAFENYFEKKFGTKKK